MGLSGPIPIEQGRARRRDPRPSRSKGNPPSPVTALPAMPDWLEGEAATCWTRTRSRLVDCAIPISPADEDLLVRYAMTWASWRQLADEYLRCEKLARDFKNGGVKKSPLFQQYKDLGDQLLRMQNELGLTPKARQRIAKAQTDDAGDDADLD